MNKEIKNGKEELKNLLKKSLEEYRIKKIKMKNNVIIIKYAN